MTFTVWAVLLKLPDVPWHGNSLLSCGLLCAIIVPIIVSHTYLVTSLSPSWEHIPCLTAFILSLYLTHHTGHMQAIHLNERKNKLISMNTVLFRVSEDTYLLIDRIISNLKLNIHTYTCLTFLFGKKNHNQKILCPGGSLFFLRESSYHNHSSMPSLLFNQIKEGANIA